MKSYTDIEQSKKLAELSLENADMAWYPSYAKEGYSIRILNDTYPLDIIIGEIPAWSLAALLELIPKIETNSAIYYPNLYKTTYGTSVCGCIDEDSRLPLVLFTSDTYIDAVFNTVVWLKEHGKI